LGLVSVVSSREKEADDKNKEGGNVLVWNGPDSESFLLVRNHKTTKTHGTLKRPIPQSLKDIVNESFKKHPRSTLFVSPKTNVQFETEESFSRWAQRAFKKIFDGKAVTMNTARHSFISALDTHKMSTQDLEDVATLMGQSIGEQRKYFRLSPKRLREKRLGINLNQEGEYEIPMLESPRRSSHSSLSLSTLNGGKSDSRKKEKDRKEDKDKDENEDKEKYTEDERTRQKKEKQKEKVKLEQEKEKEKEKDSVAEVSTIVRQDTASLSLKNPSPRHGHDSRVRRVIRIR
jgi:hypothetical protein